ncbi:MAG: T9SS type A sorting domain-containing protein [Bacteroidota bacterium]
MNFGSSLSLSGNSISYNVFVARMISLTGTKETEFKNYFTIFPNPAIESTSISADDFIEHIDVTDITGKVIYANRDIYSKKYILGTKHFANGIYFIHVSSKLKEATQKLIVHH